MSEPARSPDSTKELTLNGWLNVDVESVCCQYSLLDLEIRDYLKVRQCPSVPTLVPIRVKLSSIRIVVQDLRRVVLDR